MGRQGKHLMGTARRIVSEFMALEKRAGQSILRMNAVDHGKGLSAEYEYCCQHQKRRKDWRSLQDSTETIHH